MAIARLMESANCLPMRCHDRETIAPDTGGQATSATRRPRRGKNRVAQALRMAAQSVSRTKTPLAAFYHRIKARLGGRGAITATAHKLAVLVYRMLKYGLEYVRQSLEGYTARVRAQAERALRRKAAQPGYERVPRAVAAPT